MEYLGIFILGYICNRYIFPLIDILFGVIEIKYNVWTLLIQRKYNIGNENEEVETSSNIGFHYEPSCSEDDEEEE